MKRRQKMNVRFSPGEDYGKKGTFISSQWGDGSASPTRGLTPCWSRRQTAVAPERLTECQEKMNVPFPRRQSLSEGKVTLTLAQRLGAGQRQRAAVAWKVHRVGSPQTVAVSDLDRQRVMLQG